MDVDWLEAAAAGELPAWTEAEPTRRAHMKRVSALLGEWANRFGLDAREVAKWRAAGWLHDTLRDAEPETLRPNLSSQFAELPDSFLHGPAAAERLAVEGVDDPSLLDAIRFHTLGDPRLDRLGLALIAADYLEPGRPGRPLWRSSLRARMPAAFEAGVSAVVGDKLYRALEREEPIRPEMIALWNELTSRAHTA